MSVLVPKTFMALAAVLASTAAAYAQDSRRVVVVVNQAAPASRAIAEYYALRRAIPLNHLCRLSMPLTEEISRDQYTRQVARPIAAWLIANRLVEDTYYLVTTTGVPLKIAGRSGVNGDQASVDSELAMLYQDMKRGPHVLNGPLRNPYYHSSQPFRHPDFPMYLVARLTGYSFADVKALIDRALSARNRGKFVIDLKSDDDREGNDWLRAAALALPGDRVVLDSSTKVLTNQRDVIGYASWGSNDSNRKTRVTGFEWLPGGIATEFVSTDARTFTMPPASWTLGTWGDKSTWFAGAPQSLAADFLHEGATAATGHVYEPFLQFSPRPDYLLTAYFAGRNLAQSFYSSIPALSWQNVLAGDPLCTLSKMP